MKHERTQRLRWITEIQEEGTGDGGNPGVGGAGCSSGGEAGYQGEGSQRRRA